MRKQQSKTKSSSDSALGKVFAVIGVFAALATGGQQNMEAGGVIVLILFFGVIGYAVGEWVEATIVRILFIITAVVLSLMNIAIRRFIWEMLSGILES